MTQKPTYHELEMQLKDMQKLNFEAILAAAPIAMVIADQDTNITIINHAAAAFFNKKPHEVIGRGCGHLINCIHSEETPKGCGFSTSCPVCPIMNAIKDAIQRDRAIIKQETQNLLIRDGQPTQTWIRFSVQPIQLLAAKNELLESNARIRLLSDASFEAIFISDKGICLDQNITAEKMFGYSLKEAVGRHGTQWVVPKDRELLIEKMSQEHTEPYEVTALRKDGSTFPAQVQARMIDFKGKNLRVTVLRDITERKQAEETIREREFFLQSLLEAIPIPVFYKDRDGRYLGVNKTFETFYGDNQKNITGKTVFDVNPKDLANLYHQKDLELLTQGGIQQYESEVKNARGDLRHVIFNKAVFADNQGNTKGLIGTILDITERIQIQNELQLQKEIESELSNLAALLLKSANLEEISGHVLESAKNLTKSQYGFVGSIDQDTGHLISHTMTTDIWSECKIPDKSILFEKYCGLWGWVLENRQPLMTNDPSSDLRSTGTPAGHVPIRSFLSVPAMIGDKLVGQIALANAKNRFMDIDLSIARRLATLYALAIQRHMYEQDIVIEKNKADQASKAKSEFLANMSHEIRTPINAIIGFTQILKDPDFGPLTGNQLEYIDHITESSNRLLFLINDILDLSKIEAGKIEIVNHVFSLDRLMERVGNILVALIRKKNLTAAIHIAPEIPQYIMGDDYRTEQILRNLVSNAAKFTDNGKIEILVKKYSDSHLMFEVRDTGVGIPEEQIESLFEKFYQADSSYAKKYAGTGLGLTISKELVELMDGKIWVTSQPGQGSCFYFTIKSIMADNTFTQKAEGTHHQINPIKVTGNLKILLAEDDDLNRKSMTYFLKREGHAVTSVTNGKEVLKILGTEHFDIILMDIQMPEMDGVETTRQIRSATLPNVDPNIPIIALTAYAMQDDRNRFIRAGMNDYVSKPLRYDILFEKIARQIDKSP